MTDSATLVLWRHGETTWNVGHRFQGCNADVPLSDQGLAQAAQSAPAVAAWHPTSIVCSPLLRARQTCAAAESLLGLTSTTDDRLKEIDVGQWCGLTPATVLENDPGYAAAVAADLDYRRGVTGETVMELSARAGAALRDCATPGRTTLVVSHGWALQMGVADLLGWDYAQSRGLKVMSNCAVSVVTCNRDRWRIDQWNVPSLQALEEFIARHNRLDLRDLFGQVEFSPGYDYKALREGRP